MPHKCCHHMSKGMGAVERRIADLFAATRDRALSVDDVTDAAFGLAGAEPSRAQRLSATRAAHRLLRRVQDTDKRARELRSIAHRNTEAALGVTAGTEYWNRLHQDPAWHQADKLGELVNKVGAWSRLYRDEDRKGWIRTERDYCAPRRPPRAGSTSTRPMCRFRSGLFRSSPPACFGPMPRWSGSQSAT